MKKKHYLVITPFFPSKDNFRGPYVLDQVKSIKKCSNYNVTVLKPKALFSKLQDDQFDGVVVYYFIRIVLPSNILPGLFNRLNKYLFFKKLKHLGIELNSIEVAHAHVTENGFYANILKAKQPKIKTVLQHHGFDVLSLENGKLRHSLWHRKWVKNYGVSISNKIDLHLGVSKKTLSCVSAFSDINIKAKYLLYNGVDPKKFHPIEGLKDKKIFKIGCIANFWPLKDQITLLKSASVLIHENGLTNLRIQFIGSGETLNTCKAFVKEQNIQNFIEFSSEIDHAALNTFYNTLNLFVLPSYHEAFGCVYTEAYACGVPFMAVHKQGISELIPEDEKDKWLIEKGNSKMLSNIILQYNIHKFDQKLTMPIEIDVLVKKFLTKLSTL